MIHIESAFTNYNFIILKSRRRSRKLQSLHHHSQQKSPLPISGLPVNCCGPAGSPGPLGSIATLSAFNQHKVNDNDPYYFVGRSHYRRTRGRVKCTEL